MEISDVRPKKTTKSYAARVFQESSVGVVASLANTASKRRRVYKVIAFLLCLTGFLYQSGKFLAVVFQYPTTVGIDITRPVNLSLPGLTFCDNNGINRKIFCEKYPDRCEKPTNTFCEKYDSYCGVNKTLVPKREYYSFHSTKTLEEMIEFNVQMKEFVIEKNVFLKAMFSESDETVTGPYLRTRERFDSSLMCYSLNNRVNSSEFPLEGEIDRINRRPTVHLKFRVSEDETFLPGNQPGVLFAVHNPFEAVNPFEVGEFLKPGRKYLIFVSVDEEILLPEPYGTKCVNYTQMWENRGRTGPRMQEMCQQSCLANLTIECFNCVYPKFIFGERERYCTEEDLGNSESDCRPDKMPSKVDECFSKCKDDCRQIRFSYTVQERFLPHFTEDGIEIRDLGNSIEVEVFLEGEEILVLKYSPKYMFVEVFSNIGGFIGCWLGINLLDITDIMDGFFRIIRYSLKRR